MTGASDASDGTPETGGAPTSGDAGHKQGLGTNAAARLVADGGGAILGLVTGAVTARALGPSGKGVLSALLFMIAIAAPASSFGLGEAAIVRIGQARDTLLGAARGTIGAVLGSSLLAGIVLGGALHLYLLPASNMPLVLVVALSVPTLALMHVLSMLLNAREKIVLTSAALLLSFGVTAVATIILVPVLGLGLLGGVAAQLIGVVSGLSLLVPRLTALGVPIRPRIDGSFLRSAARMGVLLEASHIVIALSQRFDQLIVLALIGEAEAGVYAVALTLGQLVIYAPFALSVAAFPRIAHAPQERVHDLLVRTCRAGLAASVLVALLLITVLPALVPLIFGADYTEAIVPAAILALGGVIWTEQWLLCRAIAARGLPGMLLRSYALSLVVMVALDLVLAPAWGVTGAAVASTVSSAAGGAYAFLAVQRRLDERLRARDLVPSRREYLDVVALLRSLLSAAMKKSS